MNNVLLPICESCGRRIQVVRYGTCQDCLDEDWSQFATHKERILTHSIRNLTHMYTECWIDYLCELYLLAYEAEDLDSLEQLWSLSDQSRMLDHAFREINDGIREGH